MGNIYSTIYESRGFIFLKNFDKEFTWVTYDYQNSEPYFLLNSYTRRKFKEEVLPLIKSGEAIINRELYLKIRNFVQNPTNPITNIKIVEPQGICLREHQRIAVKLMLQHPRYGFFLGPGTGKTLIAISFLLSLNIKSALIVTPKKVIGQYESELAKYIPNCNYIVTNYERLKDYTNCCPEAFILDESHKVKNYSSTMNLLARKIASKSKYVYLFTGTPQDKLRAEIFPQLAILDEKVMPSKTRTLFRYFNQDDYYNPSTEKRAMSNEITEIINAYTWGKKTEDVINLTKENENIIRVNKPPIIYNTLEADRVYVYNEDYCCVAGNKGVLITKLREVCNGHLTLTGVGTEQDIVFKTEKYTALKKLIASVPNSIIYYEFQNDLYTIKKALGTRSYAIVNGSTTKRNVDLAIDNFKTNQVDFLVMQSKSGNAGLDLTCTNNIIFYALPDSYIVFTQCKARINRIGQTKECNYYFLICRDTVEEDILKALKRKTNFTTRLFKIYS